MSVLCRRLFHCIVVVSAILVVSAHDHHETLTEEEANAPVDAILWIHMFLQAFVWGILFPIGMVLGITRSRWHVPLQVRHPHTPSLANSTTQHPSVLTVYRFRADDRGLCPGPFPSRPDVPSLSPRLFRISPLHPDRVSALFGDLS